MTADVLLEQCSYKTSPAVIDRRYRKSSGKFFRPKKRRKRISSSRCFDGSR